MRCHFQGSRVLAIALVFAMAGFSYAVSTSSSAPEQLSIATRGVGTGLALNFTNPLVLNTTEYDLGDVCGGGSNLVRYVTAEGGLKPYRFTSEGPFSLANVTEGIRSTLTLGLSGMISGSIDVAGVFTAIGSGAVPVSFQTVTGAPGIRFQVTVQDAKGTAGDAKTAFFNLFFISNCNTFRFAQDTLPSGRLGVDYSAKAEVIGGVAPFTFSLVGLSGAASPEALGLFVSTDGTIYGKPLLTGTFGLRVRALDSKGTPALNRAGTAGDQVLILTVNANSVVSSDATTISCSITGDSARTGRDNLRYQGVVNILGQDRFSLANSAFSFRVGSITVTGNLSANGSFDGELSDGSVASVRVSPTSGVTTVRITHGSFATLINATALKDGVPTRLPLQIAVGDAVVSNEVLDFETDVSGTRFGLNYRLGRTGSNPAGGFQIVKVLGKDVTNFNGIAGDKWKVDFLIQARSGIAAAAGQTQGLDNVTQATVRIGTLFSAVLNPTNSDTKKFRFAGGPADSIRQMRITPQNAKGGLITNSLLTKQTGIPLASQSSGFANLFFPLGVDLVRGTTGAPFTGEHARRIFGLRTTYKDALPRK